MKYSCVPENVAIALLVPKATASLVYPASGSGSSSPSLRMGGASLATDTWWPQVMMRPEKVAFPEGWGVSTGALPLVARDHVGLAWNPRLLEPEGGRGAAV